MGFGDNHEPKDELKQQQNDWRDESKESNAPLSRTSSSGEKKSLGDRLKLPWGGETKASEASVGESGSAGIGEKKKLKDKVKEYWKNDKKENDEKDKDALERATSSSGEKKKLKDKVKENLTEIREDKKESSAKKTCKKKSQLWEKLGEKKISVNPARLEQLEQFQREADASPAKLENLICINLSESVKTQLQKVYHIPIREELSIDVPANPDAWYPFKHFMKEHHQASQAVLYERRGAEILSTLDRTVAAMATLLRLPLVILVRPAGDSTEALISTLENPGFPGDSARHGGCLAGVNLKKSSSSEPEKSSPLLDVYPSSSKDSWEEPGQQFAGAAFSTPAGALREYTKGTWPLFQDEDSFLKYIANDLPKLVAVRDAITADISKKADDLKDFNKFTFGLKRAVVAFVPFAVTTVNLLGIMRLVKRILCRTGMLTDKEAQKASVVEALVSTAKNSVLDQVGDVYSMVIFATVLSDFTFNSGVSAAVSSLDALDFALLGSISVVTGLLATVAAHLTRPQLVDTVCSLIASLQLVYLINPKMRREGEKGEGWVDEGEVVKMDEEAERKLGLEGQGGGDPIKGEVDAVRQDMQPHKA